LIDVWSVIWYAYLARNPPLHDYTWFFCYGFLLTGLTLLVIGLAIGRIGRSARHAELPPEEVTKAEVESQQIAAARAPMMAPVNPGAPVNQGSPPLHSPPPVAIVATPANTSSMPR
jgi:hypothetical protein